MNIALPVVPITGRIDREGRLVSADAALMGLQLSAGGSVGGPIAIPQIAVAARLAARLRILISRAVVAADGEQDVDLWVRARPEGDEVLLSLTGWRTRPAAIGPISSPTRDLDLLRAEADWLWETDESLRIVLLSPEVERACGLPEGDAIGQSFTRLFRLGEGDDGEFPILAALAAQRRFDGQRAELRGTEPQPVILAAIPLIDGRGRFAGFRGSCRIEAPAAAKPVRDTHIAETPDMFSKRLDVALRRPLGRIVAHADSIRAQGEGPLRGDYAVYAGDIASAGRHLLELVDDLVDLQAIERPGFTVASELVDLADVARRAAGLHQVRAADRDIRIDRPADDERLAATGEFRRALQILVNLIGNAVRYSPPGGMVWIRTEREGDLAVVVVADQGKGIAPEDHARIFDKFGRVDASEPGGSGLGLYISRRLARAMGGDIAVDSAPGQGARFVFTLPIRET